VSAQLDNGSAFTASAAPGLRSSDFRTAMRQLAGTVTVVTSSECGIEVAMTATSVCSVSVQPAQLLVCINRGGRTHELITRSRKFAVNVLAAEQAELARYYSAPDRAAGRLMLGRWLRSSFGPPLLADAAVTFTCETLQAVQAGTHTIFIGLVLNVQHEATMPLLYRCGAFGQFVESAPQSLLDVLDY
jgi:flavin reductase (DIM6/NTAB) family NADH-FMN oxidoreductase RutF